MAKETKKLTWQDLANPGCRKCLGKGVLGSTTSIASGVPVKKPFACGCAIKNYVKLRERAQQIAAQQELARLNRPWWRRLFAWMTFEGWRLRHG
jgi:hypothetical protein